MSTVIIDVDISPANASQKAAELATSIQKVKDAQTVLTATGKKNTQEYQNNTVAIKKLTQEQKAYTTIANESEGSNNQLRAQLVLLTNQYNALSKSERENTAAGKALQAQTRAISDELKANEKAVGDNRRNVGNYKDALGEASAMGVPFVGQITTITTSMGALSGIIKANVATIKIWKLALASTGIGALVIALGSLITYLASTQAGMDKITSVTRPLIAVFQALIGAAQNLGEALMNPQKALEAIFNFFKSPIDGLKNAAKETSDFFKTSINAGKEIDRLQKDIEKKQLAFNENQIKYNDLVDELLLKSKDTSLSFKEREKASLEIIRLRKQEGEEEAEIVKQKIAKLKIEQSLNDTDRKGKQEMIDLQKQLDDAQDRGIEAQKEQMRVISGARKELTTEAKKASDIEIAARKEATEAMKESERVVNNFLVDARQAEINNINLEINKKIEIYKKYGKTVEALEAERNARLLALSVQYHKEDLKQIEAYRTEQENIAVESIQNEQDKRFAQSELQRRRNLASIDKEIAETEERIAKGDARATAVLIEQLNTRDAIIRQNSLTRQTELQEQYDIDLAMFNQHQVDLAEALLISSGSEADRLQARQILLEAMYQQDIDMAIKTGADTTLITAQYEQEKRNIQEDTIASATAGFKNFSTGFQKLVGENTLAYKIAGEVQAKVDAAQSLRNNILIIQENIKALSAQGKLPFPYNIVAIFSTLAALAGAVASAKTLGSMPAGFAEGGEFVSDGKGAILPGYSKHDNINARLRSGEGVVVSEAMQDPSARNAISAINVAYGGRDFSVPNYTGAFATGGIAQGSYVTTLSDSVNQSNNISDAIIQGLVNAPPAIVDVRQIITESQKAIAVQVKQTI